MDIRMIDGSFAVCKIADIGAVDMNSEFWFLSKTDEEISLVCDMAVIPSNATDIEKDWKLFKIDGVLDFGLVGIIANISNLLAGESVSIFVVSTYNTDYFLVKATDAGRCIAALKNNGICVI